MRLDSLAVAGALYALTEAGGAAAQAPLEIHHINVGWGSSVLVRGPSGTTVLLEAGNTGKGAGEVVPYLRSIGIPPSSGLGYTVVGHQHCDHVGGLDEVIAAGYDVRTRNYYNGSGYSSSCVTQWNAAAAGTTAGAPAVPAVGGQIALGSGATLTFVAVNGRVIGGGSVAVSDENDRSIAVLVKYGGFDYLWASDLGGGSEGCTGRSTGQVNVESAVINAISPGGAAPRISAGGIDVLSVNHHGSESSTNSTWMNKAEPAVAVIGTGAGQTSGWDLPRMDVVDGVLLSRASCVTAPPALVLQTEEGSPTGPLTSFSGYAVGNIRISTPGSGTFTVSADGDVTQGPNQVASAGLPETFVLDSEGSADATPPTTAITAPAPGSTVSGTITVTASAADNVGVARVEFWLDGALRATDTAAPYQWSWNTGASSAGSHTLFSTAFDAAGNQRSSAAVSVTVAGSGPGGVNIGGWRLVQQGSSATFVFPANTVIPDHGYLVLGRSATKAAFEAFWRGGTPLPANAVYLNAAGAFLVINGGESYTLTGASGATVDGRTVSMGAAAGSSVQRRDPCLGAGLAGSWTVVSAGAGTPGAGAGPGCARGVVINEFSDALGTGNFVYEFVELHLDR
jgi:beta-lactamase superfamily II metal-dependent hydrolase